MILARLGTCSNQVLNIILKLNMFVYLDYKICYTIKSLRNFHYHVINPVIFMWAAKQTILGLPGVLRIQIWENNTLIISTLIDHGNRLLSIRSPIKVYRCPTFHVIQLNAATLVKFCGYNFLKFLTRQYADVDCATRNICKGIIWRR